MQLQRQKRGRKPKSAEGQRVWECCHYHRDYKLTAKEIGIFTRLSVATVEREFVELRQSDRLPIQ